VRSIFVRPSWNRQRLEGMAHRLTGDSVFYRPMLWSLTAARVAVAALQACARSLARMAGRLPTRGFWRGEGYLVDTSHGWTRIHFATPDRVEQELGKFGFRKMRVLGDDYPRPSLLYVTDWYYYVFAKTSRKMG
jgi:hypothetical protein